MEFINPAGKPERSDCDLCGRELYEVVPAQGEEGRFELGCPTDTHRVNCDANRTGRMHILAKPI